MSIENPNFENPPSTESDVEKEASIENTAGFQEAIASGDLAAAETWLMDNLERGDARWLDHRSGELFRAYRQAGDYASAKRMVEYGNGEEAIDGRKKVLEKEAGIPFEEI